MMFSRTATVSAPARLHFGFYSINRSHDRRFGGLGLMINDPRSEVSISPAERLTICARDLGLVKRLLDSWWEHFSCSLPSNIASVAELPMEIVVKTSLRHMGLGSGTQIALALGTAIFDFLDLRIPSAVELSLALGRAGRSAIGTHGFLKGGFLADRGLGEKETVAPLDFQTDFPEWPILLIVPEGEGLSGETEVQAFEQLENCQSTTRNQMLDIAKNQIIPAIVNQKYEEFASAIYEFGYRSGTLFSKVQKGPFCNSTVTAIIREIRELGNIGTGQSSWGPGIFAILKDECQRIELETHLKKHLALAFPTKSIQILRTHADNQGVQRNPLVKKIV